MTPKQGIQIHIRVSICLRGVFCLEGQCALNHLPQRFCAAIHGKMYEKKNSRPICFVLSSFTNLTLPIPLKSQNGNMKIPKPFCSLPISKLLQFLGQYGLDSRYYIFHVYQYLRVLHNIKEPQEERMDDLQTSGHTDLFMGSCLGLKPSDLASQRQLSDMRHVSNVVLKKHVFLETSFKTEKTPTPN